MKQKVLNNFKLNFYTKEEWYSVYSVVHGFEINLTPDLVNRSLQDYKNCLIFYAGKVCEITEELAEQIVNKMVSNSPPDLEIKFRGEYYNYENYTIYCKTAKESFESLSKFEYCTVEEIKQN